MTANKEYISGRTHQCIVKIGVNQPYMFAELCMRGFFIRQIDVSEESLGICLTAQYLKIRTAKSEELISSISVGWSSRADASS